MLLFLGVGSVLVGLFLGYHLLLARWNMTTYESYKWRDYEHHCLEAAALDRCEGSSAGLLRATHVLTGLIADSAPENSCATPPCRLRQLPVMWC